MPRMNFKCPKCEHTVIEEVMQHAVVSTNISFVYARRDEEHASIDYGETSTDYGEVSHYQCNRCGQKLRDDTIGAIDDAAALAQWLFKHEMLEETDG